jgi:hypothetical protein
VIFAVFQDGVVISYNESAKVSRGGFAVGGRTPSKGNKINNIFQATSDSVRIYINDQIAKGSRGGFAVGGRTVNKGVTASDFLSVTADSTRITTRNPNGGFAIQDTSGNGSNYLNIKPENMFIGKQAGEKTVGYYNSFFGHQSGENNT